jgi:hypothetical protein
MNTLSKLHTLASELFEEKQRWSIENCYAEALQENFESDGLISSNDLGLNGVETFAKIYNFEDGYAVLIDCECESCSVTIFDELYNAQKFATDKVYELASE